VSAADVRDAVLDRFGRIWALARASIVFVDPRAPFVPPPSQVPNPVSDRGGSAN
jgi:hypothetical protein